MSSATDALEVFRRHRTAAPHAVLPAIFVLEPTMYVAAALVASWGSAATLQVMRNAVDPNDPAIQGTLAHAIDQLGVRTVVVCREGPIPESTPEIQDLLDPLYRELRVSSSVYEQLGERNVAIEVLWFDMARRDVFLWNRETQRFEQLDDEREGLLLDRVAKRAGLI